MPRPEDPTDGPGAPRRRRPRTTDGVLTGFANIDSDSLEGTLRPALRSVKTAEGSFVSHRVVEFNDSPENSQQFPVISRPNTSGSRLSRSWRARRVNESPPRPSSTLSRHEWGNELARHILSLYASSKALEVEEKSQSIISFVDSRRPDSAALLTMRDDMYLSSPLHPEQTDSDILRGISSRGSQRASTAAGGSRVNTASGKSGGNKFMDFVAEESFGFVFTPSRSSRSRGLSGDPNSGSKKVRLPKVTRNSKSPFRPKALQSTSTTVSPIWFVSSGDVVAEWKVLPNGSKLQVRLDSLKDQGKYKDYVHLLERIIGDLWSSHSTQAKVLDDLLGKRLPKSSISSNLANSRSVSMDIPLDELPATTLQMLWRQLIVVANAMAIISVEKRKYSEAFDLLCIAESSCKRKDILEAVIRKELKAYIYTTMAYYYYRRNKVSTALDYSQKALGIYEHFEMNDLIASTLLHISAIFCIQGNLKESHRVRCMLFSNM